LTRNELFQKAIEIKADASSAVPSLESCNKCVDQMSERFDENLGGFSKAPKFPQPGMFSVIKITVLIITLQ